MEYGLIYAGAAALGAGIGAILLMSRKAPVGYEDATGFYYGEPPATILAEPANTNLPTLTAAQQVVLAAMSAENGFTAAHLAADTLLPVERVNAARRELRQMGLASYGPLFNEDDGRPHGSGYVLTDAGAEVQDALRAMAVAA